MSMGVVCMFMGMISLTSLVLEVVGFVVWALDIALWLAGC